MFGFSAFLTVTFWLFSWSSLSWLWLQLRIRGVLTRCLGNDSDIESLLTIGLCAMKHSTERKSLSFRERVELHVMFSLSYVAIVTGFTDRFFRFFCFSHLFPLIPAELKSIYTVTFLFPIVVLLMEADFLYFLELEVLIEVCLILVLYGNENWDGGD